MKMNALVSIALSAAVFLGCSGRDADRAEADERLARGGAPERERSDAGEERPDPGEAPNEVSSREVPPSLTLPANSEMHVALNEQISTGGSTTGTAFTAALTEAPRVGGRVTVPAGSIIRGTVMEAERAARVGGKARLSLVFKELVTVDGRVHPLSANPLLLEGQSTASGDLQKVLGGAVGGAVIGGILGGKRGAARGAGAGAAAGGVLAVATRGQDIVLEPGTPMIVTLNRSLTIPPVERARATP